MYPQRHRSFVLPVSLFILPSFSYFVKSSYRRHYLPSLTLYHHGRSKVSLFFFPASHSPSVYLALYLRLSSSSFISQLFFSSSCSCLHSVSLLFLLSLSFPLYCFSFTCWCNASVLYASALPHSAQMWAWYLSVANTELIKPVFYLCRLAVALCCTCMCTDAQMRVNFFVAFLKLCCISQNSQHKYISAQSFSQTFMSKPKSPLKTM